MGGRHSSSVSRSINPHAGVFLGKTHNPTVVTSYRWTDVTVYGSPCYQCMNGREWLNDDMRALSSQTET